MQNKQMQLAKIIEPERASADEMVEEEVKREEEEREEEEEI